MGAFKTIALDTNVTETRICKVLHKIVMNKSEISMEISVVTPPKTLSVYVIYGSWNRMMRTRRERGG